MRCDDASAVEAIVMCAIAGSTIAGAALASPATLTRTSTVTEYDAHARDCWMSYCDARRRECSSSNCFVRNQLQHNCVRGACAPHTCFARNCCCTSISRACLRVLATYVEGDMAHMPLKQLIHAQSLAARLHARRLLAPRLCLARLIATRCRGVATARY